MQRATGHVEKDDSFGPHRMMRRSNRVWLSSDPRHSRPAYQRVPAVRIHNRYAQAKIASGIHAMMRHSTRPSKSAMSVDIDEFVTAQHSVRQVDPAGFRTFLSHKLPRDEDLFASCATEEQTPGVSNPHLHHRLNRSEHRESVVPRAVWPD